MPAMEDVLTGFVTRKKEIEEWLSEEFKGLPSGSITPSLVERVVVPAYGGTTPLGHCATIVLQDNITLLITPYDMTLLQVIEKALREQITVAEVSVGETSIRVTLGAMTGERRAMIESVAKERVEEAKRSIRGAREKVLSILKQKKTEGELSEDEEFSEKKQLQKEVDEANSDLEKLYENKLKDMQC